MSTNDPGLNPAADGGNLDPDHFDPRLKRALGQAPDRAELPDWRVRRAILDQAHEAVSASEALLAASQKRTGWDALRSWFRGRDDEGRRTRGVPWGAALATAAVAVLATLIWQHEPLPGARPDAEPARPGGMTESRKEGVSEAPPAALPTPTEPTAPAAAPAPAAPAADMVATAPPSPPAQPAQPAPTAPPPPTARADASSGPEPSAERPPLSPSQMQRLAQSQSRAAAAAPPPTPSVTAEATAPPQSAEKVEPPASTSAANERAAAAATATAKDSAAAAAAAAGAAPAGAGAGADSAAAAAAPPAPAPPPDYSSLARWPELRIAHVSGDVRVISRARAGALVGLLNTAAAQPQGPGEAMRGLAYFRVMLERRGETLALLEVGGNQLRWTEGGSVPVTSRPAPADLAALENALRTALRGSGTPRAPN